MMRPPRGFCAFIIRNAPCVHRKAPVRLAFTTACHCSRVSSSSGTGRGEQAGIVEQEVEATEPGLHLREEMLDRCRHRRTSVSTAMASAPSARAASATSSSGPRRRPAKARSKPGSCEPERDRSADPGPRPCDDRDPLRHARSPFPGRPERTGCCNGPTRRLDNARPCVDGASPSGKAAVFGTAIRRFESSRPSHPRKWGRLVSA